MFKIMSLQDIVYWIRSARSDAYLTNLMSKHKAHEAFDILYTQRPDPWGCKPSFYQQQKHKTLLSLISSRRYSNAIDIGCGEGLLTQQLASVADKVLGIDISDVVVCQARRSCTGSSSVYFQCDDLYSLSKDETFDLVIVSDVLIYRQFSEDGIKAARDRIERLIAPKGILLLVNHFFFGFDKNSQLSRKIHDIFGSSPTLSLVKEKRFPFYLASIFESQGRM